MDHVTVNKLWTMLGGKVNKNTVRRLITKMVQEGFVSSTDCGMGN